MQLELSDNQEWLIRNALAQSLKKDVKKIERYAKGGSPAAQLLRHLEGTLKAIDDLEHTLDGEEAWS